MNHLTYKRITNVCIVVAAGCVILFDKFPGLHKLAGGFLIASGIAAVAVHLYVQWHPFQVGGETRPAGVESPNLLPSVETTGEPVYVRTWQLAAAETGTGWETELFNARWTRYRSRVGQVRAFAGVQGLPIADTSRPSIDLDTVMQVCERLAASEMDFEVTLTGDGSLTIRPIRQRQVFKTTAWKARLTKREVTTPDTIQ